MHMIYAVLDTNVLVSALMSKSSESTVRKIINAVVDRRMITLYSPEIIAEYEDVLSRDKFNFLPEAQKAMIDMVKERGIDSERRSFDAIMPDESDRVFYEVAPVTPILVTPAEMLEILSKEK